MARFKARYPVLEATFFAEAARVKLGGVEVAVPAGSYLAVFQGGAVVLAKDDFEALYGPALGSYQ